MGSVFVWLAVAAIVILLTVKIYKPVDAAKAKLLPDYQEKKQETEFISEDWGIYGSRPC